MTAKQWFRRLGIAVPIAVLVLTFVPAGAVLSGVQNDDPTTVCDTIDFTQHPQNTLRPPFFPYKYKCEPILDIKSWEFNTDGTKIVAKMTLGGTAPQNGDPVTLLPEGFNAISYNWYFQADHQEQIQLARRDCLPQRSNFHPTSFTDRVYLQRFTRTSPGLCEGINNGTTVDPATGKTVTNEVAQKGNGTFPASDENFQYWNQATSFGSGNIMARIDGHWLATGVDFEVHTNCSAVGPTCPVALPVGVPPVGCKENPATPGKGYPSCLKSRVLWGFYEGYTGTTTFRYDFNHNPIDTTDIDMTTTSVGNVITITLPYNVKFMPGVDDDLLKDDVFSYPIGKVGSKVTAVVPYTAGVALAGSPWKFCPGGPDFFPEPGGGAPPGWGSVPALPDQLPGGLGSNPLAPLPRGVPQSGPLGGLSDGGKSCAKGLVGVLTLEDWAPNDALQLRLFPRSPSFLPSAQSLSCRYPASSRPLSPVPFGVVVGPVPNELDLSTSPYHKQWWIEPQFHSATGVKVGPVTVVPAGGSITTVSQAVPGAPNPVPAPVPLPVGKAQACNYQYFDGGIHYFDKNGDWAM